MNLVLGARGRLGRALVSTRGGAYAIALARSTYEDWWREGAADEVSRFLEQYDPGLVFVAAGIIDPSRPQEEHDRVNHMLARNAVIGATRTGWRAVTFGSVIESMPGAERNPYLTSKARLGTFVGQFAAGGASALHVQGHTLYGGGPPERFMFFGQMLDAIVRNAEFRMSPGRQLREYHHVDDEVPAIARLAATQASGVVHLSHGAPVRLARLAETVFESFGCPHLLRVGALPAPVGDNYTTTFERVDALKDMSFRDAIPSIIEYLHACKSLAASQH